MANTTKWSTALNLFSKQGRRDVENEAAEFIINLANARIWCYQDWRQSIAPLPPFFLIPEIQDYAKPLLAVPPDFYGLRQAYLVNTDATPSTKKPLRVVETLLETHVEGIPESISYEKSLYHGAGTQAGFRVSPRPSASLSCTSWLVDGTYKVTPERVLSNKFNSTLVPYDDMYLDVVLTALQWAYGKLTSSPQTPAILQELNLMLQDMAAKEGFNLGDPVIAPAEPLVMPYWTGPNLF